MGWDVLSAVNPKLVLLRISGYGQTGPYANRPCFGRIANAFGGISFLSGESDRPPAQPGSATLSDYMAGLFGAYAVQLALRARDRTGRGQVIDVALYDGIFRILDEVAPAFQQGRLHPQARRGGNADRGAAQPLPDARRPLDRDRLHQRSHLRPPRPA